jgi:hypothetical protein
MIVLFFLKLKQINKRLLVVGGRPLTEEPDGGRNTPGAIGGGCGHPNAN